jgi:hypothetical protein
MHIRDFGLSATIVLRDEFLSWKVLCDTKSIGTAALHIHSFKSHIILYRWDRLEILAMPEWCSVNVVEGYLDIWWEGTHGRFLTEPVGPHRWTRNTIHLFLDVSIFLEMGLNLNCLILKKTPWSIKNMGTTHLMTASNPRWLESSETLLG